MLDLFKKQEEKKVEYIELIYDLIFVFLIGKNNVLLHTIENGFISPSSFLTYFLSTLIILQIWYLTTIFINKYGENGLQENIAIFINMYLLYYMAVGIGDNWREHYYRYNIAWMLILFNIVIQYAIKFKKYASASPQTALHLKRNILILVIQIIIIAASLPVFKLTGVAASPLAMIFGLIVVLFGKNSNELVIGDFAHLTERVMLYVVFTFGEMIIAISEYFEGGFSFNTVYFSLGAFSIVAGLFLTYGFMYDNVIDREQQTHGSEYMIIHVFMIMAMNNITAALEFMRMSEVRSLPKTVFIFISFAVYFVFLFMLEKYAQVRCKGSKRFFGVITAVSVIFGALIIVLHKNSYISIALSAIYIYTMFFYLYYNVKRSKKV